MVLTSSKQSEKMLRFPSSLPANTFPVEAEHATDETPELTVFSIEAEVSVDMRVSFPSHIFPYVSIETHRQTHTHNDDT